MRKVEKAIFKQMSNVWARKLITIHTAINHNSSANDVICLLHF